MDIDRTPGGRAGHHRHLLDEPHHDPSPAYCSDATPALGDEVAVRVRVPHAHRARQVVLRTLRDGEPLVRMARPDGEDDDAAWWTVDVPVHNRVTGYRFLLDGADGSYAWLNGTGRHRWDVTDAHDFRLLADAAPAPDWVCDAVVYQVFPDRFARSGGDHTGPPRADHVPSWAVPSAWDDEVAAHGPLTQRQWFGGDLGGVAEHLDHLVGLGATVLYLTPMFQAGSNHRYDAVTFERIDPLLGGNEALAALAAAAHRRGLRILGDLTTNHTGDGHEWFRTAQSDPTSPEAGFYSFGEHPHTYASWLDVPSLPKLDHGAAGLAERLHAGPDSVVARWLREPYRMDGWRIDVANMTGRLGPHDRAHRVARAVRAAMVAQNPDGWLLAEHGHDASGDLAVGGWHGTMNYAGFTRPLWSWLSRAGSGVSWLGMPMEVPQLPGTALAATLRSFLAATPWAAWARSVNPLDSHDTARLRTVVGDDRDRQLVGLALQATLPGVPMVFAGDEIGLTGTTGEHSRTPFPWDRPERWDEPTLAAYRTWLGLRRDNVALRRGGLRWVHIGADSVTFLREHPEQRLLVHVSRGTHDGRAARLELPRRALGLGPGQIPESLAGDALGCDDDHLVALPTSAGAIAHVYRLH